MADYSAPSGPPPNYKPSGNPNLPQQPPQAAFGANSDYYNQAGQQERGFGGYPQQHQGGYPQQGGYPPQGYPQQGGYPPQGYPPQQGYYPQGQQPMMYQQQPPMMYQQAPPQKQRSGMEGCLAALCCLDLCCCLDLLL